MKTESATQAKIHFGAILDSAAHEPVVIQKSGRNIAVILSFSEYQRIIALEDQYWIEKANKARKKGSLGTKKSEKFLEELLRAKD